MCFSNMAEKLNINRDEVEKAISVLLKLTQTNKKKDLISEEYSKINLQFAFKKIPKIKNKVIKLPLPNLISHDTADVCLFVKDLDKKSREHENSSEHFKDLLQSKGVKGITQIIPLKQLKLEYQPYEAKRNLSNMFDIHLADKRIYRLLPTLLGKEFYGRKKLPIGVNMAAQDLKSEINKAIGSARCIIKGQGSSSMATIGHTDMSQDDLVENVLAACEVISNNIPGGPINIRNFYLKTEKSVSLPIYVSLESANDIKLPKPVYKEPEYVTDDVTTVVHGKVRVGPYGHIKIVNKATLKYLDKKKKTSKKSKVKTGKVKDGKLVKKTKDGKSKKKTETSKERTKLVGVEKKTRKEKLKKNKLITQKKKTSIKQPKKKVKQ